MLTAALMAKLMGFDGITTDFVAQKYVAKQTPVSYSREP
jgi:hypothetical protein